MNKDNDKKVEKKIPAAELEKISTKDLAVIAVGSGAIGGHRAG